MSKLCSLEIYVPTTYSTSTYRRKSEQSNRLDSHSLKDHYNTYIV